MIFYVEGGIIPTKQMKSEHVREYSERKITALIASYSTKVKWINKLNMELNTTS